MMQRARESGVFAGIDRARGAVLSICVTAMASACAAEPEPEPTPPLEGKLSSLQANVFTPTCATSSCHSSTSKAGNLELTSGKSFAQLVNVFAENGTAKAEGVKRVAPGKAEESFLVIKVQTITKVDYGVSMPTTSPTGVPADQLAAIKAWINNGAKDN